ncbi:hypothetical protein DC31_09400 [Microbacterium sp. CH12i]|nr:hypothetical protein DC31_09400 [Microbacterium sp. CH12i]
MRDHIERGRTKAVSQRLQETLDPRFCGRHLHDSVQAELHRICVAPQQRIGRIETGQHRWGDRGHVPILVTARLRWGAATRSVDKSFRSATVQNDRAERPWTQTGVSPP